MAQELRELLDNASSLYFNYPVCCILITNDNKKFYGVNVETASPSAGICAERNALYNAISCGYKKGDFKEFHIMNKTDKFSYPCFICRQALYEYAKDAKVIVYNYSGENKVLDMSDLCPYPFDGDNL